MATAARKTSAKSAAAKSPATRSTTDGKAPSTPKAPPPAKFGKEQELKAYRDMLATVHERVQALVRDGKTMQEAVAAKPSAEFDELWGKGFLKPEQFVSMVWNDLKRASTPAATAPASAASR